MERDKCSVCGTKKNLSVPYDMNKPVFCGECDPSKKCVVCGEQRMKPMGHSEFCEKHWKEDQTKKKVIRRGCGLVLVDKTENEYGVTDAHLKDMNTRVNTPDGEYLSGDAGLKYMKSQGNTYAKNLKEYYKR